MKPIFRAALFSALPAVALQAGAADWQNIRKPIEQSGGGYLQYDRATIIKKGTVVSVWTRAVYEKEIEVPEVTPALGLTPLKARVVASLTDIDCTGRTETTKQIVFLAEDGETRMAERGPFEATNIVPDTQKDRLLSLLCVRGRPR